jgi:Fe-S cluster biogenesis protein NfuA
MVGVNELAKAGAAAAAGEDGMNERVEAVLREIRPMLRADGGDVELVGVDDGVVKVKLTGACGGCPMSQMTLKMGIEKRLKERLPEVKGVVSV